MPVFMTEDSNIQRFVKKSPFSGKTNEMLIECTVQQVIDYESGKGLIQNIFPDLTPDKREFIMTGITPDEFPSDPDE